jgi:hypothetical protein
MTVTDLAQLITRRIITRALEEPNPVEYFARAVARMTFLEDRARISGNPEAELLEFGREFGLLVQGIEKQN